MRAVSAMREPPPVPPSHTTSRPSSVAAPSSRPHCVVRELRDVRELEAHLDALYKLQHEALEDNGYVAPAFLLPLLRQFEGPSTRILTVWNDTTHELVLVMPVTRLSPSRRVPLPALSTFTTPHGRMMQPIVHRAHAAAALRALWDWIEAPERPWHLVLLEHVWDESPFYRLLRAELQHRGSPLLTREATLRPVLQRRASFDAYLGELAAARRKGYRRKLRDLEKRGRVSVHVHRDLARDPALATRFMEIERRGWKGAAGTALAAAPRDRAFFTECVARSAARGELYAVELQLDGVAIAMSVNFLVGETLFAFKIGFDEAFADYSPGILVELEGLRHLHEQQVANVVETGSAVGSYVESYFFDRRRMQWLWTPTRRPSGRALITLFPVAQRFRAGALAALARLRTATSRAV